MINYQRHYFDDMHGTIERFRQIGEEFKSSIILIMKRLRLLHQLGKIIL